MRPVSFPEQNAVFAKDQPEYLPLPARVYLESPGAVISCWGLTWRERLALLFTGRVWVRVLTFGDPLQPIRLQVKRPRDLAEPLLFEVTESLPVKERA